MQSNPRTIPMPASLDRAWIEKSSLVQEKPIAPLTLDFIATEHIDSAGIALIYYLNRRYEKAQKKIILKNVPDSILASLKNWSRPSDEEVAPQASSANLFARIGDKTLALYDVVIHALSMLTELLYWGSFGLLKRRDFRRGVLAEQMYLLGYKAFAIVTLLSFIMGVILALQSAIQLDRFGGGIFLAPLIGISMIKELGPLLTAVILSGRNGSATTAEIATMVVGEEIDALKTMGINPIQFIVVPKLWAMTLIMPCLSMFASAVGIFGGYLVAIFYLQLSPSLFIGELIKYIILNDVMANIVKSTVFSWLIVWVGTFHGFKVKGGAEDVGRETTASVVSGLFMIIIVDSIFSFIF